MGSYVPLKRSGRMLKGLCPFHGEKTPSFYVYPESQSFYCFGCGAGGGTIQFIQRIENIGFVEAVRFIAERVGLQMPEEAEDDGSARLRLRVLEANREAARRFFDNLSGESGKEALDYLRGRGLSPGAIRRFGLGYAPDNAFSLLDHMRAKGFADNELIAANLVRQNDRGAYFDVFRGRVMFPIIDLRGNVIAFGGRLMGEGKGPKYLNTNDTLAFKKSRNLYALNFAKSQKGDQLILAEGYMDVIALHQGGFGNAVATLGTALTSEQARLIVQYAPEVVIAYDADTAGQAATRRATNLLDQVGLRVRVLTMEGAKDPDEYIKRFGKEKFAQLLLGSGSATDYEILRLKNAHDLTTNDGKVAFTKGFCRLVAGMRNPVEADVYITSIANELGIAKDAILSSVSGIRKQRQREDAQKSDKDLHLFSEETPVRREDPQRAVHRRAAVAEDRLIRLLLKNPDYGGRVMDEMSAEDVVTDLNGRIFMVIFDKIAAKDSLSVTSLSAALDEAAMRHLSWLLATGDGVAEGLSEAMDYVNTIKAEHHKVDRDLTRDDNAALNEYIQRISKTKKQSGGPKNGRNR